MRWLFLNESSYFYIIKLGEAGKSPQGDPAPLKLRPVAFGNRAFDVFLAIYPPFNTPAHEFRGQVHSHIFLDVVCLEIENLRFPSRVLLSR